MVFHVLGFGTFQIHEREDNVNSIFAFIFEWIVVVLFRVSHGDKGVSDRDHCLSIYENASCF